MLQNIAVFNPLSILGGSEISLLEMLKRGRPYFNFHLILPEPGPLGIRAASMGITVHTVNWPQRLIEIGERDKPIQLVDLARAVSAVPRLSLDIAGILRRHRCRMLVTNGLKCHVIGAVVSKKRAGALVWYMREGLEGRPLTAAALRVVSPRCDRVIAISRFVAADVRRYISRRLPVHTIYNAVDFKQFRPDRTPPADLAKAEGEIWFGIIGAVTPLKGQDLFLRAAAKVVAAVPMARFFVVGANFYKTEAALAYESRLRDIVTSLALADHVVFLGYREDVADLLCGMDVAVQSNRGPEGLGRSVLEAMACAVPVIAVDRWGPAEIIENRVTGVLFPPMDVDRLAQEMIELAGDARLRKQIGSNAMRWVRRRLDPDKITTAFVAALTEAMPPADEKKT